MALYRSPDYQTRFESTDLSLQEKKFNIDFQDGTILDFHSESTVDLQVTYIISMKFRVSCRFGLGEKVQNRFSKWRLGRPS